MFDLLSRSWISVALAGIIIAAATQVGSISARSSSVGSIATSTIDSERVIVDAIIYYKMKNGTYPASIGDLVSGGFLLTSNTVNMDGKPFELSIDSIKKTVSIITQFSLHESMSAFIESPAGQIKPAIYLDSENKAITTFILPKINDTYFPMSYVGTSAPLTSEYTRWYDTSGAVVVFRKYDTASSSWVADKDAEVLSEHGVYSSASALVADKSPASDGESRYAFDSKNNSIQKYTKFSTGWFASGGGQTVRAMASTVPSATTFGFTKIPGSEGYTFAGVTPLKGWAVMKWTAAPLSTVGWTQDTATKTWKLTSDTSSSVNEPISAIGPIIDNHPISFTSHAEAENACRNWLVDGNGNPLSGGHLIGIGLWNKISNDAIAQPINWNTQNPGATGGSTWYGWSRALIPQNLPTQNRRDWYDSYTSPLSALNFSGSAYDKRIWVLSNGEFVHDLSGNVAYYAYELHGNNTATSYQDFNVNTWTFTDNDGHLITLNPAPINGTVPTRNTGAGAAYMPFGVSVLPTGSLYATYLGGYYGSGLISGSHSITPQNISPLTYRVPNIGIRCVIPIN